MKAFFGVLFEISNEDRYRILIELTELSRNVTQISKKLDLSLTETSRHLSRLGDIGLTKKSADGLYSLTSYSKIILRLIPAVDFITRQKDYFLDHTLAWIPQEFIGRIGELSDVKYIQDQILTVGRIEAMMREAEEYIWIIHDQYLMSGYTLGAKALRKGVKIRCIDPKSIRSTQEFCSEVSRDDREILDSALSSGLCDLGTLDPIDVFLYLSEKEVAIIGFPTLEGKFDYLGFYSREDNARKWCKDVFEYYWKKITPKHEFDYIQIDKASKIGFN